MKKINPKVIIILGPTSSGKSSVAIKLAREFDGEIISADSRQIYRGMDVGTGKITPEEQALAKHWMLDIVSPKTNFSAAQFKKKADKIIRDILKRKKLPIICGGTGFWIKSIVDNITYPEVKPDWKLRKELDKKSAEELFAMLKKSDPTRAENIDAKNKVRLIRAIEICKTLGQVPSPPAPSPYQGESAGWRRGEVEFLQIGISVSKEKLHTKIKKRLDERWKVGMIEEVKKLHEQGLSFKKIQNFGLGYFWIPEYLQEKITLEELHEKVFQAEKDYAKRQITWFRKDPRIKWIEKYKDIKKEVEIFLKS